ncbi:MAG: VOC family protein [Planctomycetia bacterium]|nr:VOC family protein [Planctomycetia bacterium]MCC7313417.1 VOC family protein [Planctomycetota bacterium]OQZ06707.1 MAG: glyoxalase [Planctomycetes bacterium UTPLA1]
MAGKVNPIPEGFNSVTPHIVVKGAKAAMEFYKKAFGAEEVMCIPAPDGSVMHAEIQLGNSRVMIAEENPQMGCQSPKSLGGSPITVHLYVNDVDSVVNQAVKAGATSVMPITDMFWGDRYGMVTDPFGHKWSVATHTEDLTPEQIGERMAKAFAGGGCGA